MDKNKYEERMETHLRDIANEKESLMIKLHMMTGRARDRIVDELDELEKREEDLLSLLSKVRATTDDSWKSLKADADLAWEDVKESWRKIKSKIAV